MGRCLSHLSQILMNAQLELMIACFHLYVWTHSAASPAAVLRERDLQDKSVKVRKIGVLTMIFSSAHKYMSR